MFIHDDELGMASILECQDELTDKQRRKQKYERKQEEKEEYKTPGKKRRKGRKKHNQILDLIDLQEVDYDAQYANYS